MIDSSFVCPICQYVLPTKVTTCPNCGEDVTALAHLRLRSQIFYNEGLRQAEAGNVESAVTLLQQAIHVDASYVDALIVLGKLYAQQGQLALARNAWLRAVKIVPDHRAAQTALSQIIEMEHTTQVSLQTSLRYRMMWIACAFLNGILISWLLQIFFSRPTVRNRIRSRKGIERALE